MIEVGSKAPEFTLGDQFQRKISLSQFSGQQVMLVFYPLDFTPT